jgi:hypothetical protein
VSIQPFDRNAVTGTDRAHGKNQCAYPCEHQELENYVWTNSNLQERAVCFRLHPDEPVQNVIHDREQERAEDGWEAPDDTEPRHHS